MSFKLGVLPYFVFLALCTTVLNGVAPEPCDPSRVYDALIVIALDQPVDDPSFGVFGPMNPEDNTAEFRSEAVKFFEKEYGLTGINPDALASPAPIGINGTPFLDADYTVWMTQLPEHIRYNVLAIDFQEIPQLRHRMPISNVHIESRVALAHIGPNIIQNTGNRQNLFPQLFPGSIISMGFYRLMATDKDGQDFLLDTIKWVDQMPSTPNAYGWQPLALKLESDLFGEGISKGGGSAAPPVPEGVLNTGVVMTFPPSLTQKDPNKPAKCKQVKPDLIN
jgi:hypothetical protein